MAANTSGTFRLDRAAGSLLDAQGRRYDREAGTWHPAREGAAGTFESVDTIGAATWLQRESGCPRRAPVGVIGPREATAPQLAAAEAIGNGLAAMGFVVICGGRGGVMEAVCKGAATAGGITIGLLPDPDDSLANRHVRIAIATGIGEARNALIARAALCLMAVGNSFGTLSEVALGRQFGKLVIGLEGAPHVNGVRHVQWPHEALEAVARFAVTGARDD
ncbi:MAG TPA: hypothetical protein VN760_08615 [Casimicrobiaceae bacterium]|nr:hypothetical protein [Casimicrobiaceae bacterium]